MSIDDALDSYDNLLELCRIDEAYVLNVMHNMPGLCSFSIHDLIVTHPFMLLLGYYFSIAHPHLSSMFYLC